MSPGAPMESFIGSSIFRALSVGGTVTFFGEDMIRVGRVLLVGLALLLWHAQESRGKNETADDVVFTDVRTLGVEGQGWTDVDSPFDRLPKKAKDVVRPAIWKLQRDSAGLSVRFVSDATAIDARWTLTKPELAMKHMPATGVSGLDLYVKNTEGHWHWLATGQPPAQTSRVQLVKSLPPGRREYLLYFPLYNGVTSGGIGVPKGATLSKADPRPADNAKPIVFYGTSITQGGCASRPGMCHPAILGRRLDRPVINLGFSGNGIMEPEIATLLAELDPAVYVIDCLPNMGDPATITERARNLVKTIRKAHAATPIVLVEDRTMANAFLLESIRQRQESDRAALRKVYESLVAAGDQHLLYLPGDKLLAADGEDTVDGSHPTDLGFVHQSDAFEPVLRQALGQ
jgi:hypothetical protein